MVKPAIATRILGLRLAGQSDEQITITLFNAGVDGKDIADTFDSIDASSRANALAQLTSKFKDIPGLRSLGNNIKLGGFNLPIWMLLGAGGLATWLIIRNRK